MSSASWGRVTCGGGPLGGPGSSASEKRAGIAGGGGAFVGGSIEYRGPIGASIVGSSIPGGPAIFVALAAPATAGNCPGGGPSGRAWREDLAEEPAGKIVIGTSGGPGLGNPPGTMMVMETL